MGIRWERRWAVGLVAVMTTAMAADCFAETVADGQEDWEKYEIRVIRPRYFAKRNRLELGAEMAAVMNQTFIYTYMVTGLATYHFSEYIGLELNGSYGFSIDKDEQKVLKNEFSIQTKIYRTQYALGGALLWTPIYGKFQMPSGRVVYFDTFLAAGAGMTGIHYQYDWCVASSSTATANTVPPPAAATKPYPGFGIGVGQRFFVDKKTSIKWDLRDQFYMRNQADGSCDPSRPDAVGTKLEPNVMLQFGASRFL